MRIDTLSLKGLLRFTDPVTIDFRTLPPGLIAIVGENGAGKTTLLEAPFGLLHRQLPSRDGELAQYATSRDSFIDAEFAIDGVGAFHARVNLDGPKRGTDAVLEAIAADGSRIKLNDGKASTYDRAVRERFPSPDVMLASSFRSQNGRGRFEALAKKDRKERFIEFLGLQRYAVWSQTAASCAARLDRAMDPVKVRVGMLDADTGYDHMVALDELAHTLQRQGGDAEVRKRALADRLRDLEARLAVHADTQAAYTLAAERVRAIDTDLATKRERRRAIDVQRRDLERDYEAENRRIAETRDRDIAEAEKRIAANRQIQEHAGQIEQAVRVTAALDESLAAARESRDAAQRDVDSARQAVREAERELAVLATVEQLHVRAVRDAETLTTVPCGGEGEYGACRFLTDARAAQARIEALAERLAPKVRLADAVAAATLQVDAATQRVREAQTLIAEAEQEKAKHRDFASRATILAESNAKIAGYQTAIDKARVDCSTRWEEAGARIRKADHALAGEATTLDLQLARLGTERAEAASALAETETGNAEAIVIQRDRDVARAEWDGVISTIARVEACRADLERRRQELAAKRAEALQLREQLAGWQRERDEWQLLASALGRDGLPTLEIDASGDTISAYTNTLLEVAYGTRFTVQLVTQQAKANGKGMKEAFTIEVFDNLRGGDVREIADLSGGEQTIVAEALMNAIALYANQTSPLPIRTCWRDETTGALDPENAVRYLQMLRKVHALGGYHHIVFITHNADVAAMADVQIHVKDGRATVALPPFTEAA